MGNPFSKSKKEFVYSHNFTWTEDHTIRTITSANMAMLLANAMKNEDEEAAHSCLEAAWAYDDNNLEEGDNEMDDCWRAAMAYKKIIFHMNLVK